MAASYLQRHFEKYMRDMERERGRRFAAQRRPKRPMTDQGRARALGEAPPSSRMVWDQNRRSPAGKRPLTDYARGRELGAAPPLRRRSRKTY